MLGMEMGPKEELSSDGDFQCHLDNLCSRLAQQFLLLLLLQVGLPLRGKVEEEEEEERNSLGSLQVGGGGVGSTYRSSSPPFHSGSSPQKRKKKDHEKEPFSFPMVQTQKRTKGGGKNCLFESYIGGGGGSIYFPIKTRGDQ